MRYAQALADEPAAGGWRVHAAFSAVTSTAVVAHHHNASDAVDRNPRRSLRSCRHGCRSDGAPSVCDDDARWLPAGPRPQNQGRPT